MANALEVKNVAYNSESGYGGYIEPYFSSWNKRTDRAQFEIIDNHSIYITKVLIQNVAILYISNNNDFQNIPSKYRITGVDSSHPIMFGSDSDINNPLLIVTQDGEYEVNWKVNNNWICVIGKFIGDCNITIEQVAQYPNGLLLDGVEDHAVNTVIPAVTDFTVIGKRNILNHESGFAIKGGDTTSTAAFILEYGSDKFYNFGGVNTVEYPNTITVATKSSYNNNPAVSSQGVDSLGLRIGEYRNYYSKLVFYKLMFYTKTIDQLSINMLKNLFALDGLIDVTHPIFTKAPTNANIENETLIKNDTLIKNKDV